MRASPPACLDSLLPHSDNARQHGKLNLKWAPGALHSLQQLHLHEKAEGLLPSERLFQAVRRLMNTKLQQ